MSPLPHARPAPVEELLRRREGDPELDPDLVRDVVDVMNAWVLLRVPIDQPNRGGGGEMRGGRSDRRHVV